MSLYAPFSNNEDPCTGPWCLLAHTAVEWPVTGCYVPFVYPTLLSYRGQGSSAALHMEYTDGRALYQAACDRAYHGVIAIGHW